MGLAILLMAGTLGFASLPARAAWTDSARRLTGESAAVRAQSIERLRADRRLRERIAHALGTSDRFLALDVITALGMKSLLPELLRHAETDDTGFSYHAINSILDDRTRGSVARVYAERVSRAGVSPAARLALLDSLSRTRLELEGGILEKLARDPSPEVRAATLSYWRSRLKRAKSPAALAGVRRLAADDPTFQVRAQALYLLAELGESADVRRLCARFPDQSLRTVCEPAGEGAHAVL